MTDTFDPYRKWLGIPPEEQPPHHYRLLGIALFEDDPDVIENAADRQMAHVRKFQSGRHGSLSQRILNELASAKLCLLNAEKKQGYDRELRRRLPPDSPPQANQRQAESPLLEPPPIEPPRAEPPVALPPGSLGVESAVDVDLEAGRQAARETAGQAVPTVAAPTETRGTSANWEAESQQTNSGEDQGASPWTTLATTAKTGVSRRRRSQGKKMPLGLILSVLTILSVIVLYLVFSSLVK